MSKEQDKSEKNLFVSAVKWVKKRISPLWYNNKMMVIPMTRGDFIKAEEERKTWTSKVDKQFKEVQDLMNDYNDDATFKDNVLKAIGIYKTAVTKYYRTLGEIRKSGDKSKVAKEDIALNKFIDAMENVANELNKAVSDFQASVNK